LLCSLGSAVAVVVDEVEAEVEKVFETEFSPLFDDPESFKEIHQTLFDDETVRRVTMDLALDDDRFSGQDNILARMRDLAIKYEPELLEKYGGEKGDLKSILLKMNRIGIEIGETEDGEVLDINLDELNPDYPLSEKDQKTLDFFEE